MSVNVATDTCRECPAPITQPANGHRRVFCAACIARRRVQATRRWRAARSPEEIEADAQAGRERAAARSPEQLAALAQAARERTANLSPEKREARAQYQRECSAAWTPEKREARAQSRRERIAAWTPEKFAARARDERERNLQKKYGIGVDEFDALLAAQAGRCAICRTDEPGGKGQWHVDHNHESGAVRGILCPVCNVGLGHFKDNTAALRTAAAYIESTRQGDHR